MTTRRADAQRNREKILEAARAAFAEGDPSMAEIARRAEVGMATLYRNFPGRRELLEALYIDEVDAMVQAAETHDLAAWAHRFVTFAHNKHPIAHELLRDTPGDPLFNASRTRVLAAGRPLLEAAQRAGEVRPDLTLEQILDMVIAIARIDGDAAYVEPILETALAGLRPQ
ncbi:TetR/AcrR family transcriptional regulator [Solirubrobacter sp. CPCC 204708]|uniref:TetR/AcrR family transcriptional regulator n=1 Tax=Solirubrobacter deserti TaxID=2282478 RepID=A0ABT4RGZ8_9ACTN|nr:TetR/AcrR family transcriptional regulator [Solirubrobacter deserti]MBE2319600.1 TetR/AcrR family transcriptional regulator [Solirubrobacter deserti]MDA0137661.1 TetR/AcrR family transcriptional regulator [Solirubrobacter deserti]